MSIERFIPEVWSARLLQSLRAQLVYASPRVVNRDYEGEIRSSGDTVRITSISRPKVGDYVPNVTRIEPENLSDAQRTLTITESKYYAYEVDDVDQRQALGNVMPTAQDEAAYAMAEVMDDHVASHYTQAQKANVIAGGGVVPISRMGADGATDGDPATYSLYEVLVAMGVKLDQAEVPAGGRWVVVPPWCRGTVQLDDRFAMVDHAGQSDTLYQGTIATAAGFQIMLSNRTPRPAQNQNVLIGGQPGAISHAEQLAKTEAYRPESSFSDAVKGLSLYGSKVIRPEGLTWATVTRATNDRALELF